MKTTIRRAAVVSALAALALSGCHREAGDQTVGQRLDNAIDRTHQKLAEAGDKTQQKLNEAGEKIAQTTDKAVADVKEATVKPASDGASETGKAMSDTAITASVKADFLKDPDLSVLRIDVDTKGGVVTLNGLANDEAARGRAEKFAGAIKGVKEVRNFLVVKRA